MTGPKPPNQLSYLRQNYNSQIPGFQASTLAKDIVIFTTGNIPICFWCQYFAEDLQAWFANIWWESSGKSHEWFHEFLQDSQQSMYNYLSSLNTLLQCCAYCFKCSFPIDTLSLLNAVSHLQSLSQMKACEYFHLFFVLKYCLLFCMQFLQCV